MTKKKKIEKMKIVMPIVDYNLNKTETEIEKLPSGKNK